MAERVLLVGIETNERDYVSSGESMNELNLLARTAGAMVVAQIVQKKDKIDPGTYIGKGKALDIKKMGQEMGVKTMITDFNISPAQQRNLENMTACKVIDRTRLILDIFAHRAHSREGQLQVELAQLDYLLPRLGGKGIELAQQVGGIGVRGPGEKKLEVDRRRIRDRIALLKQEIEKVRLHRGQQRKQRKDAISPLPIVAIIGYTNSGKSTLLNKLSGSYVFVQNKLFATLDPTIRRVTLPGHQTVLFTDTVGFIDKLPHQVVAAFRATLEEVHEADMLINLIDISHPQYKRQQTVVESVLREMGLGDKPLISVYSKIDLMEEKKVRLVRRIKKNFLTISALTGQGITELLETLNRYFEKGRVTIDLIIPQDRNDMVNLLYEYGHIIKRKDLTKKIHLTARINKNIVNKFKGFLRSSPA